MAWGGSLSQSEVYQPPAFAVPCTMFRWDYWRVRWAPRGRRWRLPLPGKSRPRLACRGPSITHTKSPPGKAYCVLRSHFVVCEQACDGVGCGACVGQGTEAPWPVPLEAKIAQRAQGVSREDSMDVIFEAVKQSMPDSYRGWFSGDLWWKEGSQAGLGSGAMSVYEGDSDS